MRVYGDIIDTDRPYGDISRVLALHRSILLVKAGNPKAITGFDDLLDRDDIGMVVVDGNYHNQWLTSGTALWEDVIGRTGNLDDVANLRSKICEVASGCVTAHKAMMEKEGCDVWVGWEDWALFHTDTLETIELPEELVIYRPLGVIPTTNPGGDAVHDFIDFALSSEEAMEAMKDAGWHSN